MNIQNFKSFEGKYIEFCCLIMTPTKYLFTRKHVLTSSTNIWLNKIVYVVNINQMWKYSFSKNNNNIFINISYNFIMKYILCQYFILYYVLVTLIVIYWLLLFNS